MRPHKVLHARPRETYIHILRCTQLLHRRILSTNELCRIVAALIRSRDRKGSHCIADAEGSFIAAETALYCTAVEHTGEHPEPIQSTVPCRLGKAPRNLQQGEKIPRAHKRRTKAVKLRSLLRKAIRCRRTEPMREIAARDTYRAPPQPLCHGGNALSEPRVQIGRQPRNTDAHHLNRRISEIIAQKGQRNHRAVIECRRPLTEGARRNIVIHRRRGKRPYEILVIVDTDRDRGMSKCRKISFRMLSR